MRDAIEVNGGEQSLRVANGAGARSTGISPGDPVQLRREELGGKIECGIGRHLLARVDRRFVQKPHRFRAVSSVQRQHPDLDAGGIGRVQRLVEDRFRWRRRRLVPR